MNQGHVNNNYQTNINIIPNTPNYITSTIEYATPIIYPTKNIYTTTEATTTTTTTTTTTNNNSYVYNSSNTNDYYNFDIKTSNDIYFNNDQNNILYSNPTYSYPTTTTTTTNNNIYGFETSVQTNKNNNLIKSYENYNFNDININNQQIQKHQSADLFNSYGNDVFTDIERSTNYQQSNPLNLNELYNYNNIINYNTNTKPIIYENSNITSNTNVKSVQMQSGNTGIQKKVNQRPIQNKSDINSFYLNNQKIVTTDIDTSIYNTNTYQQNYKINDIFFDLNEYFTQPNTIDKNNKIINNNTKASQEPKDNIKSKSKYCSQTENLNNTMPIPKIPNDITNQYKAGKEEKKERKSFTSHEISNFEILINNISKKFKSNNIPEKINNITFTGNNANFQNNVKNAETKNDNKKNNILKKQKKRNVYKIGNSYVSINGKSINKKTLSNSKSITNVNQKPNLINNTNINININTNINNIKNIKTETNIEGNKVEKKANIEKETENNEDKGNDYYEDKKDNEEQNIMNSGVIFDTYSGSVIQNMDDLAQTMNNTRYHCNKDQIKYRKINSNPIVQNYQNTDYFNNDIPTKQNERNNRFKEEQLNYTDIKLDNNNNNINNNYNIEGYNTNDDIQIKKSVSNNINDLDILTVEPTNQKMRRPVYKIPPSKKRSISQGKSLAFIHKYYDENFILEEDNEDNDDNASDSQNKNMKKKNLKTIFREVTNIRRLIPQWQKMNGDDNSQVKENDITNTTLNNEETKEEEKNIKNKNEDKNEDKNEGNKENNKDNNNENNLENTEKTNNENEEIDTNSNVIQNMKNNNDINDEQNNNNNINLDGETQDVIDSKIENNEELNSQTQMKKTSSDLSNSSKSQTKEISEKLEKEKLSGSLNGNNLIELELRKSLDNININIETQDCQNINFSSYYNQSILKESEISINPNFGENLKESNISTENNNDLNMNLNINEENEKHENDNNEDKKINLDILGNNLDKSIEKEDMNKNDSNQEKLSNSLKTLDSNDEYRNSNIIVDDIDGEEQKDCIKNFQNENIDSSATSDNTKVELNKEGDNL